jgi:hypothetical protein
MVFFFFLGAGGRLNLCSHLWDGKIEGWFDVVNQDVVLLSGSS